MNAEIPRVLSYARLPPNDLDRIGVAVDLASGEDVSSRVPASETEKLELSQRTGRPVEIEILVLRQQLVELQRRTPRPRMTWTDHALIAALTRLLPAAAASGCS